MATIRASEGAGGRTIEYWEKQLVGVPVVHSLPLDKARPAVKRTAGAVVQGQLDGALVAQLTQVAKAHQLTPFMLLHGA